MPSGSKRAFRTQASYDFEKRSRDAVVPFLRECGISVQGHDREKVRSGKSQIISATMADGSPVRMRVRLCWRRDGRNSGENKYSAFQLRAKTIEGDWARTLRHIADHDRAEKVSHTLAVQCDQRGVVFAALIPSRALPGIWKRQRDVSKSLIVEGRLGRRRKNHAENGSSPTLWLQDIRTPDAHAVSDVLWKWPGVVDLVPLVHVSGLAAADDTFDDCAAPDTSELGSDNPQKRTGQRSYVRRNKAVRDNVRKRAGGKCERSGCGATRGFSGFLDVHHILGAAKSDRVWNCVALCPNCHREAHYSPEADQINAQLLAFAQAFNPSRKTARRVGSARRAEPALPFPPHG